MIITGTRVRGGRYYGGTGSASDAYFDLVTLLLPGTGTNGAQNNTFQDSSTNAFTITRNGNTTQGTFSPFSQTGWSNYLNGSSYFTAPGSTAFAFGTGAFTIEMWLYVTAYPANYAVIPSNRPYNAGSTDTWGVFFFNDGAVRFSDVNNTQTFQTSAGAVPLNAWTHLAVVRNSTASNDTKIYINGTSVAQGTINSNFANNTNAVVFGTSYDSNNWYVTSYASNLRIVKGTAVYTSNFTPSTTALTNISGTSLLTCQSNRFVDNSSNIFAISLSGTPSVQAFAPFDPTIAYSAGTVGGSAYFDGSGDYLTAAQNVAFNLGSGAFTVEGFFYLTSFASTNRIVGLGDGASGGSPLTYTGWTLSFTSTVIRWYRYDGTETNYSANATINLNQWNHVAVSRDGSGNLAIFFNGVRILNQAGVTTAYNNVNANPLYIGRIDDGNPATPKYVTGYISNVRIVNGSAVYNPTSSTLVVPTAPLTAIANTSLLLNYTNGGITDAGAKNDLETVGNAQISTAQSKWGGSSMLFDGSDDYLVSPASVNYEVGTGSYTIEFWVYWNVIGNIAMLFGWNGGATGSTFGYTYSDGRIGVGINGTNEIVSSSGQATTGSWIHMAFVKNGSTTTIYKNGVAIASSTTGVWSSNTGTATFSVGGGASASDTNCYIDDLRITRGLARYTADFTPPTQAFPLL